jgi:2-oxoglutarate ferredoxin oxidoreductase subunit beta
MLDSSLYQSDVENQWCPGCSNFAILNALKKALASLDREPHQVCLVSGIGQAAKLPHYISANFFNGLHGRAIPIATGIAVSNPSLTTVVITGDGDFYGEGGNHFLHALRRNPNITVIIHDNRVYALTKGQASPTTPVGTRTRLQFSGVKVEPIQGLAIAIAHRGAFVARGYAGDMEALTDLMVQAMDSKGFSLVEVIQPCITWGEHGKKWKAWWEDRLTLPPSEHDPHDQIAALKLALVSDYPLYTGVIYKGPQREVFASEYHDKLSQRPLAELAWLGKEEVRRRLAKMRWEGKEM